MNSRLTKWVRMLIVSGMVTLWAMPARSAEILLFQNDFNSPSGYVGCCLSGDLSAQLVNTLYGTAFQNLFSVETLRIAAGTTFSDPSGIGGAYALGMLSTAQDDLVSATFDAMSFGFVNVKIDISAIDLDCCGGPFNPTGTLVPKFEFRLYDAPGGVFNLLAPGTLLDAEQITGTASPRTTFDWTNHVVALSTTGTADGNVALVIDLLEGGYASFDNLIIAASDTAGGGVGGGSSTPLPATLALLGLGLLAMRIVRRRC